MLLVPVVLTFHRAELLGGDVDAVLPRRCFLPTPIALKRLSEFQRYALEFLYIAALVVVKPPAAPALNATQALVVFTEGAGDLPLLGRDELPVANNTGSWCLRWLGLAARCVVFSGLSSLGVPVSLYLFGILCAIPSAIVAFAAAFRMNGGKAFVFGACILFHVDLLVVSHAPGVNARGGFLRSFESSSRVSRADASRLAALGW
jgi:hypothetical protein